MTQPSFGTVAPTSRRAVAYIIDALIAGGIGIVLAMILVIVGVSAGPDGMLAVLGVGMPIMWLLMIGWFVFYTVLQGGNGSIGMRAQGLRLARDTDGAPLGFGKALLRNVIFGLSAPIVVGYFTPLFDGSGRFQGWHDKVAGALMLDARAGAISAPSMQEVHVPPRPTLPNSAASIPRTSDAGAAAPGLAGPLPSLSTPSHPVPPVPGLATPVPPQPHATPDVDETVRSVSEVRAPAPSAPPAPEPTAPEPTAPQIPVIPEVPAASQTSAPPTAPATAEETLIAFVPGITQDGPPDRGTPVQAPPAPAVPAVPPAPATPAASSTPPTPPTPPASVPPDDDVSDIEDTRISVPGHRLVFTWDDGTRVTVSRRTLFGRNPAPEEGATVVSVRDETLSLSKTHFEAAAESSGGWIIDRHSTNGTVVVRDGHRIVCAPGEQVRIRLGDAIEIGDRIVTIGGYA